MDTLDQILENLWGSDYVQKNPNKAYKQQYNDEYLAVAQYMSSGTRPNPTSYSKMGKVLVGLEDQRRAVVVEPPPVEPPPVEPPPTGNAYMHEDWSSGKVGYKPWSTIFSYTPPGYQDCGLYGGPARASSPDGRVAIVPNPYGSGNVLRCEIRQGDPKWGNNPYSKSEVRQVEPETWGGQFVPGAEIWIRMEVYLPNEFVLCNSDTNAFTCIAGLHPSSNSGISAVEIANYPGDHLQLHCGYPSNRLDLIPLNDPAYRNKKLTVLIGTKMVATTSGWVEAWVNGNNVIPRKSMQTAAADEAGPYWKQGLYTPNDATFAGGKSFLFFGKTELFKTKP